MLNWINKKLNRSSEDEVKALCARYAGIFSQISDMREELLLMRQAFAEGGSITWEQLQSYAVSTAENPVGYPTGKNCVSYRLPDIGNKMVFWTLCVAKEGEIGSFGLHDHPKSTEMNIQIQGVGRHNGEDLPPFSVTTFGPGEAHNYELLPGGSLITFFEKVKP